MLKNYIKIALRNIFNNPVYSSINIFGLAVGIACCILIMLYVYNEWSYDTFHTNSERLYRAWVHEDYGDDEIYFNTATPPILAPTLESNIPELEAVTRFYNFTSLVKRPDQNESFSETVVMVDPVFLEMFDFLLLEGNPETVFNIPGSIILTKESAARYFGEQNPVQQSISIRIGDEYENFTVTGIIQDPPVNSSIRFDFLIPFSNSPKFFSENAHISWFNVSLETYVLLQENSSLKETDAKLSSMMRSVLGGLYEDEFNESGLTYTVGLQPLTNIRHNTDMPAGIAPVSDPAYSYILAAIAFLILLIACVNFMTLSIGHSASRAKEVGIRKTVGAHRRNLMYQFWGEALLMTGFALGAGVILAELLLPQFNLLSGTELQLTLTKEALLTGVAAVILVSLLAGIYPALVLSGFRPFEVLKGRLNLSADKNLFRQTMVVFQFTLSIALVAATLVIYNQLEYMRSAGLGFQKEQIVVLETGLRAGPGTPLARVFEETGRIKNRIKSEISGFSDVEMTSMSSYTPVQQGGWIQADFRDTDDLRRDVHFNITDHDFVDLYRIEVIQGRNFSAENISEERRAILVNKALAEEYGWDNPIGQRLPGPNFEDHEIIGVVENFHFESLHTSVKPLVLTINPDLIFSGIDNIGFAGSAIPRISIRLNSENLPATMTRIENIWTDVQPGTPFNFTFVDEAVDAQYRQEERLSKIVAYGSSLAIIIACLGLFGLASLMMVRRTKEIGIRKVMGASVTSIVTLLSKDFLKLVFIGFVIAIPIAWYTMNRWLEDFAYRIEIDPGVFLLAGLAAVFIALATVSWQSVKAAVANPVNSLRSE